MKYLTVICLIMISHSVSAQLEKQLDSVINISIKQYEPGIGSPEEVFSLHQLTR